MINAGNQTRMDWFKSILHSLPLEAISDILGEIAIWWGQLVKDVPAADLPMYAYLGGVIIVLILWLLVARVLPRPLGGMSWMMLFAVLLAPGTALGDPSVIAPASISVVYAIMMKDTAGAIANMLPILVVLVVGLFVGFVWQLIRGAFESSLDKARSRTAEDTQATMQLTTGNYLTDNAGLAEPSADSALMAKPEITKPEMAKTEISKPAAEVSLKKDDKPLKQADSDKSDRL
ncbi:hypothetical protein FHS24_000724 [Psychrobacter luti]|uniref:Resolvase n=1 Tax=Psychrobacter luti TaxID=198481 RepID=A0A839TF77_9GAMM|nr:hypothetical protein [Psychrobacter luti]MBB3106233.1 hypothetical protein [Psychrobacter luti]